MALVVHHFDSELGTWAHTEWRPAADERLAGVVDRIWDFDGMAAAPRERVLPNGLIEIVVQLDDRHADVHPWGPEVTPATCVTGLYSRALVIEGPGRRSRVIGIRLRPLGAWAVLAHPLSELADATADLEQVVGRASTDLADQCHGLDTGTERVRRVVAWLERRVAKGSPRIEAGVRWIASRIDRCAGNTPIRPLQAEVGWSDTRLAALFRQQVGATPKRYARILRFHRALDLLDRRPVSLAEVALTAGYYDQPHMNAEFRAMAGMTPRQFLFAKRFPNSLSLAESSPGPA
jgi:AraC-like DNA-binding protein